MVICGYFRVEFKYSFQRKRLNDERYRRLRLEIAFLVKFYTRFVYLIAISVQNDGVMSGKVPTV